MSMSRDGTRPLAGQMGDGCYDLAPSAGRELDALIAEKVMGISPMDVRVCGEVDTPLVRIWNASPYWRQDGRHDRYQLTMNADAPPYSTSIAAAWLVVEAIAARGYHWKINTPFMPDQQYHAGFTENGVTGWNGYPDYRDSGTTAPLAICRAALRLATANASPAAPGRADD